MSIAVSFYMSNVRPEVASAQRDVLLNVLPGGWAIEQVNTSLSHGAAIDAFMSRTPHEQILLLDIDCIPLHGDAVPSLFTDGALAGCVQRANHIDNNAHLYVGAFCMALTKTLWHSLDRPSFEPPGRGDVGEELTYRCEASGHPVRMLWPSAVETVLWPLTESHGFGRNTEYAGAFLHSFDIRDPANQAAFIERCRRPRD